MLNRTLTTTGRRVQYFTIGVLVTSIIVPLAWVLRVALKPQDSHIANSTGLGGGMTTGNFAEVWSERGVKEALWSSVQIVSLGALVATLFGTLAGYGLARLSVPAKPLLLVLMVAGISVPVASITIPLFGLALDLGLVDSKMGVSLIYGSIFSAWTTLLLHSYMMSMPDEVFEAARTDGAGAWGTFRHVAAPMAMPAIITSFVLNFQFQWSELILGLVLLQDRDSRTVTVTIAQFTQQYRSIGPPTAAAMVIGAVPVFSLFLIAQRWMRADLLAGAIKG